MLTDLPQPEKYESGFNFMYCTKAAFDSNGDFRWCLKGDYLTSANYDYNGHYLVAVGSELDGPVLFWEITPLGKILSVLYAPYGCHHDIEVYGKHSILVTGSEGETVEDLIYDLNTETGIVTNKLDLKTVFPRGRMGLIEAGNVDWLHMNDISSVDGGDILVSSRHQSFVARISWPDGEIKWILGNHENWPAMFEKYLLTPLADGFEWSYGQHAPVILPDEDDDPDTMDILLFDNGNQRPSSVTEGFYSRLVHYRVNERDMTVEQIWQYGKEAGELLYADARGNVTQFPKGGIVSYFCVTVNDISKSDYIEIDKDSQIIWQAEAVSKKGSGSLMEYRVTRMPIYNNSANESVAETVARNLIPEEVFQTYEE
jgi:arylsulfate sulfotransferase